MGKPRYILFKCGQIFTYHIQDDRRFCHQISVVSRWVRSDVYTDFLPCDQNSSWIYESEGESRGCRTYGR